MRAGYEFLHWLVRECAQLDLGNWEVEEVRVRSGHGIESRRTSLLVPCPPVRERRDPAIYGAKLVAEYVVMWNDLSVPGDEADELLVKMNAWAMSILAGRGDVAKEEPA